MRPPILSAFLFVCASAHYLLSAQTVLLLPPYPAAARIRHDDQTPPPQSLPDGLLLPVRFDLTTDRVYWDIPLDARIPDSATALEIDLSCSDTAPINGLSVHLQSGDGWFAFSLALSSAKRQRFNLPRGLFQAEGSPGAWNKSRVLRLSAWKKTTGDSSLTLHTLLARTDTVAIIRATERTAPGETSLAAQLSDRCSQLLTKADIPFAVIDDSFDTLDTCSLLLLPYAPRLPDKQLARLERFLKRNGKLIVFYNSSRPLGLLLGVRPGAWQGTESGQEWTALLCDQTLLPGAPARIPHLTGSILPPFAAQTFHARKIANWADETSRTTDLPACVLTDRGAWFAHVPPLAYPSAVTLLRLLAHTLSPADVPLQPSSPTPSPLTPLPAPPPEEIRAVWTSATAHNPRGWDGLMHTLSKLGINTLFIHLQSAGTSLYKTRTYGHADTLTEALAAGKKQGVAVHAWVTCWTLDGANAEQTAQLTREDRLMRDAAGNALPWLCPSQPENRALIIAGLRDLARLGVQGIHLDYVRYPEARGCYAPATRKAFETAQGKPVSTWPADVLTGGSQATDFQRFRCDTITAFVREAQTAVRTINPSVRLSAAVYPGADAAAILGQDWPGWVRDGLIDFACPMIYTENENAFTFSLDACIHAVPQPQKNLVPGIGTGTDMSQLDATATSQQVRQIRTRHLAGFGFFALDDELLTAILPSLLLSSGL